MVGNREKPWQARLFSMPLNPSEFRKAMGCFATGVTIITVDLDGEVHGMTANAFASVSLDLLLVLVCVDHNTRTHAHLHAKKSFGINVLGENQRAISEYYARPERTHEHAEAEAGARFDRTKHGTPMLQGRWRIWNAACTPRRRPATIPSSSPKSKTWSSARASRYCFPREVSQGRRRRGEVGLVRVAVHA